ncbi:hypothetical protein L7F22_023215 [Adiantum nelumboides]|nr:hypothetical protein [Adiantum nelumboides]
MSHKDVLEEKVLHRNEGPGSASPYKPPPQFKEINTPPLLPEFISDTAELWLVRIQDNQLKADEFKGKCVSLALNASGGQMGCFEDSKGSSFEILDLHNVAGVQPFAFVPKGDSSLEGKLHDLCFAEKESTLQRAALKLRRLELSGAKEIGAAEVVDGARRAKKVARVEAGATSLLEYEGRRRYAEGLRL